MSALQELKRQKSTIVLITHKTNILSAMDKLLVMAKGQVQGFGDREEIFARLLAPRVASIAQPPSQTDQARTG